MMKWTLKVHVSFPPSHPDRYITTDRELLSRVLAKALIIEQFYVHEKRYIKGITLAL